MASYIGTAAESDLQKNDFGKQAGYFLVRSLLLAALIAGNLFLSSFTVGAADFTVPGGPKYTIDDTRWMTVGMAPGTHV